MKPEEFWELTWYDFGLWCLKIHKDHQKEKSDREWSDERLRHMMALYWNGVAKNAKSPHDFFKIVEEKKLDPVNSVDDAVLWSEMKRKFGSKVKKRG